jgi:hypothetical protein
MIRSVLIFLTALASLWSAPVLAWGAYGHRTVAAIALKNVTPATRQRIAALLMAERDLGTSKCRANTLEDAAVWPDCIRGEGWRWAYTSPWHYHDQPICKAFDAKADCPFGNCVTAQIERNARLLADRSLPRAQRLEALAFLAHFVGDIHQPLHGADNHDQGGNKVKSTYGIVPGKNLHSIWDSILTERAISSAAPPLVRHYDAAERAALATGDAGDWLRESWTTARDFLYPTAFGKLPCDIDPKAPQQVTWPEPAIKASLPIIEMRIEQAGLRLARMLDAALA